MRGLVERGAIGLITTHDLALADIADALGERAANVHFEDQIEDGQIRFDYRMRPGRGAQEQRDRTDAVGGAGDLTADEHTRTGARVRLRTGRGGARRARRRSRPVSRMGRRRATPARWDTSPTAAPRVRDDPRNLLPSARSIICVGKLYQTPWPHSTRFDDADRGWISRYAWGDDYHDVLRRGLERLDALLRERAGARFESKICVDTAPLLERSLRAPGGAGLDRQEHLPDQSAAGLVVLPGRTAGVARDRAGRAAARPLRHLHALHRRVPHRGDRARRRGWTADALCISYFTIELRGAIPEEHRAGIGAHVFGCDICQDVCPWNGRAPVTDDAAFAPRHFAPPLEELAAIDGRGVSRHVPRHARSPARDTRDSCATWRSRWAMRASEQVPRAAGEAGRIGRPRGRGARPLGALERGLTDANAI